MDKGEPSRKSNHAGGAGHKPLKKARFVWQVKGKYHLRDNNQMQASSMEEPEEFIVETESDTESEPEASANNNNIPELPTTRYSNCCIDNLLVQANGFMEKPRDSNIDRSIRDEIPVTLVKPKLRNQDDYMHEWQARQVAKSFVDNTINSILEHWRIAASEVDDFDEDCENGEQVEDEGIMMAIQSHGLQSGPRLQSAEFVGDTDEVILRPIEDPIQFINAAITAAIQKKGLSSN